jgi:serine/threonine protein kinase
VFCAFSTPSTLWAVPTLTLRACSISTPKASHIAISNPRYAILLEFSPMDDSDTNFIPQNVLLTKDDPPIVKVADFGLAKAVDSLTMLRVRSLARCLFALTAGGALTCIISLFSLYRRCVGRPITSRLKSSRTVCE